MLSKSSFEAIHPHVRIMSTAAATIREVSPHDVAGRPVVKHAMAAEPSRVPNATPIVFVVDGDASERESLEVLISDAGWQSETFESANGLLSRPRVVVPSCLILDITLPGSNGLDLQKRFAAERPDMPIIFITRHGDVSTAVRAMKAGAVEFLMKPFNGADLLNAIHHAIERSASALRF